MLHFKCAATSLVVITFGILVGGVGLGVRFLYYRFWVGIVATEMTQSLILAAILSIIGFMLLTVAVLADLLGTNRRLLEEALYRIRKLELDPRGGGPETRPPVGEPVTVVASAGDEPGRGS